MKNKTILIFTLVLCVLVGMLFSLNNSVSADISTTSERILTISGEAEIDVEPDIAYINIGVKTEAVDSKKAQSDNDLKMKAITEKLVELGVDNKNIKTTSYNLYPKYNYHRETGESKIVGYVADNTITVEIRDITKLGIAIDKVIEDGANVINGISFDVSNREELYNEALKEAVKKTEKKALAMAEVFGATKVSPKEIVEGSYNLSIAPVYRSLNVGEMAMDGGASISTGEITVKAVVSATYSY